MPADSAMLATELCAFTTHRKISQQITGCASVFVHSAAFIVCLFFSLAVTAIWIIAICLPSSESERERERERERGGGSNDPPASSEKFAAGYLCIY